MSQLDVKDGYITGKVDIASKQRCGNCLRDTIALEVTKLDLPQYIKPSNKLIFCKGTKPHGFIGIGCGCYAKGHRQIAHITDRVANG